MLELETPTEPTVEKLIEGQEKSTVLDLSKKGLKKVPKPEDAEHIKELILDENLLQKIDNIDSFLHIEKVKSSKSWQRSYSTIYMSIENNKYELFFFFVGWC